MKLKKLGSGILALSFVGLMGVSSAATQAQDRYGSYDQNGRYDQNQRERQRQWEREQRRQQRRSNRNGRYDRNGDGYSDYGGSYNLRQTALNAGFNEGVKEGRKDRSRGDRFDFTDEGADSGMASA